MRWRSIKRLCLIWLRIWRYLNGESRYRRYLLHWQRHHANRHVPPLNRKAFFADETQRKWNGIKRCC